MHPAKQSALTAIAITFMHVFLVFIQCHRLNGYFLLFVFAPRLFLRLWQETHEFYMDIHTHDTAHSHQEWSDMQSGTKVEDHRMAART